MSAEYLSPIFDHLWQSTVFAAGAGVLVMLLRSTQARTRYALWLAASLKFLVPFAVFMAAGSRIHWRSAHAVLDAQWSTAVTQASQPFTDSVMLTTGPTAVSNAARSFWMPALALIWVCGFAVVIGLWFARWRQIRAMVRSARPSPVPAAIRVLSSSALLEPSVFGIFRPVLLLPDGIEKHLTSAQLEAIYAHELCHVQRRDNLAAALHMLVEALFWFHPLVWWLEARLIEERERACDEEVLQAGNHPQDYAESILEICKLCLASPPTCAAGVSGADLQKRIETIMSCRIGRRLNSPKKVLLAIAGVLAVIVPVGIGLLNPARAQEQPSKTFEVVSVKPSDPATLGHSSVEGNPRSGRFTAEGITAKTLIENAYGNIHLFQIEGAPSWADSERYDISAKAEGFGNVDPYEMTDEDLKTFHTLQQARLQAVLADRFQLKVHRITKELPVYLLMVAKNGPKLQPTENPRDRRNRGMHIRDGQMTATGLSTELLAANLSNLTSRVVIDKTGLSGHYDFTLNWAPDQRRAEAPDSEQPTPSANGPSIFTAVQEQLGLKLVPAKGAGEILVIDHIERPSPN